MKKVVISCGAIPAKLDSVKFITNRFKGGLAFKTAEFLNQYFDVTIVKWKFTEYENKLGIKIINITDVIEYFEWYRNNALNYDAFVMAGAVANLMPSNPYKDKFPSHNYKVGEKFNIEFEIAPRAIDIIKSINSRCCLIGYKLFDAKTDEELIEIAKHTLKDSKANVIFANMPQTAKEKKIALTQDGATIPMDFEQHLEFIKKAINSSYFKTEFIKSDNTLYALEKNIVTMIDKTFEHFGTIAVRTENGFITTHRGHAGNPVFVKNIEDLSNMTLHSNGKATLNAPLLANLFDNIDCDYIIHRHENIKEAPIIDYEFPGTFEEAYKITQSLMSLKVNEINIRNHGYIKCLKYQKVNWENYYNIFPSKYFLTPLFMEEYFKSIANPSLEVGGNKRVLTSHALDLNVLADNAINITYEDLRKEKYKFNLIILRNCINYLKDEEIKLLINSLNINGVLLANTFQNPPSLKMIENEIAINDGKFIIHYLYDGKDTIFKHNFYSHNIDYWKNLGFIFKTYGRNSLGLIYKK